MIVVTGGEGFIGRNLVKRLKDDGHLGVVVLDTKNEDLDSIDLWLSLHAEEIDVIFHLGAITDTMNHDYNMLNEYNVIPSVYIWHICYEHNIPLIYASSAATYGDGKEGFDDDKNIFNLKPLNPYGESKQLFDEWAIKQVNKPPFWYGLKFFNVYGQGEDDKDDMASVVYQKYQEIKRLDEEIEEIVEDVGSYFGSPAIKLFKSHRADYEDGEQKRDFVYIDDIVDVCVHFMENTPVSGIYNVGTGKARTFNDLIQAIFKSLGRRLNISYIDTPISIRANYQYFTEAKTTKLRNFGGYRKDFHELEEGVNKYINILENENC